MIKNTDNILALYSDDGHEKLISLSVLTTDKTVIEFQITGNVSEDNLIGMMEGYIADLK
ncbi:hypothetical protein [Paenibacillus sp. IHBB 10380]|uniref:hypothetical protein n=1 Tax=Paenibacillus sp. IHBB 10380 TaxID=1566358 RepID=UPI000A5DB346|nr:hypothetical protein [Paenibacillus sp. IHBB 10380]